MNKANRYRTYPTKRQEVLLSKAFGCVSVLWNRSVAMFNSWDKHTKPKYQTSTELRDELEWVLGIWGLFYMWLATKRLELTLKFVQENHNYA